MSAASRSLLIARAKVDMYRAMETNSLVGMRPGGLRGCVLWGPGEGFGGWGGKNFGGSGGVLGRDLSGVGRKTGNQSDLVMVDRVSGKPLTFLIVGYVSGKPLTLPG